MTRDAEMRRSLILLALLLAGSWGERAEAPTAIGSASHGIAGAADSNPVAFIRSGSSLLLLAWQEAPGPDLRARSRHPSPDRLAAHSRAAAREIAFATRELAHLELASRLGLLRAGFGSFHAATPPPFRSV